MTYALRYAAHSEIGLVRKNNQDSGYASPNMLVVADGMGGAAAGDLASAVAIDRIREVDIRVEGEEMLDVLTEVINAANDRIADLVAHDHSLEGMGTTVSGALFDGTQLGLAHIGDSRAYRLRDGELERLTHDHSWVQFLVDDGKISEDEAAYHPHRSLLLKVLNGQPANDPDVSLVPVQAGDRLLFCSDGLCGLVDDPVIARLLAEDELTDALDHLVAEARREGGIDNITVIVADVIDADDPGDEAIAAVLAAAPLTLGAAVDQDIPDVSVKPRVIDLGDKEHAEEDSDEPVKPDAPEPTGGASPPSADEEEERYAPQPPPRRRWKRPLVGLLVVLLLVVGGGGAGYAWSRTQYFVGAADEQVAIFRGLPGDLPGASLHEVYERQPLKVAELPVVYQEQVRDTIGARDLESARASVAELTRIAEKCAEEKERKKEPSPKPSPSKSTKPSATPDGSASPDPSASPDASASPSASPTPSPEPTC